MKVSIVIPTYNSSKTISKTVEACLKQTYFKNNPEVIVVDDGSNDNTKDIIKNLPIKYLYQSNAGPAKARNLGWKSAEGEIIYFTDSDCVPEKDCIENLVKMHDSNEIASVGGSYGIANPESLLSLCIHNEIQYRHSTMPVNVRYLGSFNVAVKKSALESVNGFDESFKIACAEDADLSYRLIDKGFKLRFNKNSIVNHYFPTNIIRFSRQQFFRGYWLMKLFFKHRGKLGKDDYSKFRDTVQPLIYFSILCMFPLCIYKYVLVLWILLNVLGLLIHLPVVTFSIKREKHLKMLFLFILLYLRGFSWALGCFWGTLRFFSVSNKT
jgi:glycosyltransferase involved in cell wall biosynthesis